MGRQMVLAEKTGNKTIIFNTDNTETGNRKKQENLKEKKSDSKQNFVRNNKLIIQQT